MIDRTAIMATARAIAAHVRRTPVLELSPGALGPRVALTLKLESLQVTGSFKPRGAFARLLATPGAGPVVAASGGNHGAAVAHAARALGRACEIFVPELTGPTKRARIAAYGARLVVGGADYAAALAASMARAAAIEATVVHAYDQPEVLAGQGTLAAELEADAPDLTHVLVATGGGGLIGGIATWYAGTGVQVVSVEPEGCPCLSAALAAGQPVPAAVGGIAADSLGARQVGALGFAAAVRAGVVAVTVPDAAIAAAQALLWDALRLVAEPGGATALAALVAGAWTPPAGARVGVVLCGGNTEPGSVAPRSDPGSVLPPG